MYLRATTLARGDYAGRHTGDPGLFGFLGGIVKKGLGIAGGLLPGPAGAIARFAGGLIPRRAPLPTGVQRYTGGLINVAGPRGLVQPPGGFRGFGGPAGMPRKRRRMNPGNVRALRRAMRRQDAFVKLARRALKGSKYRIATVGSSRSRRPLNITESGPGGVTVSR